MSFQSGFLTHDEYRSYKARKKSKNYRKYRALKSTIQTLREMNCISVKQFKELDQKVEGLFKRWKRELVKEMLPHHAKRGRKPKPKLANPEICKRKGCNSAVSSGKAYCSREHAPYGHFSLADNSDAET